MTPMMTTELTMMLSDRLTVGAAHLEEGSATMTLMTELTTMLSNRPTVGAAHLEEGSAAAPGGYEGGAGGPVAHRRGAKPQDVRPAGPRLGRRPT
eukprot:8375648-Pyramimonas_sp.AAC.1